MGFISIDHRGTCDATGTKNGCLQEWDSVSCPHCQAVLKKHILGPCRTKVESPGECDHCRKPLCVACAERLKINEVCPGEMRENVDRAWQGMRSRDSIFLAMRS